MNDLIAGGFMKHRISRPSRALLPLAMAACALAGNAPRVAALAFCLMLSRGLALNGAGALRAAAGSIVNGARLRGNFLLALALHLLGGAATVILCGCPGVGALAQGELWLPLAGALLSLATLFSDRLSLLDNVSGPIFDVLLALFTATGLLISRMDGFLLPACVGVIALAGGAVCLGLSLPLRCRPGFKLLKKIPLTLVRSWLIPFVLTFLMVFTGNAVQIALICGAWAVFECFDSPLRRIREECMSSDLILGSLYCTACLALLLPDLSGQEDPLAAFCLVCAGSMLVSSSLYPRSIVSVALMLASGAVGYASLTGLIHLNPDKLALYLACILSIAAMALLLPNLRDLLARKLQRSRKIVSSR